MYILYLLHVRCYSFSQHIFLYLKKVVINSEHGSDIFLKTPWGQSVIWGSWVLMLKAHRNRSCNGSDHESLQHIMRRAKGLIQTSLPSIHDIFLCVSCIIKDLSHSSHRLFVPRPSGRRIRSQDEQRFLLPVCQSPKTSTIYAVCSPKSHMNICYLFLISFIFSGCICVPSLYT